MTDILHNLQLLAKKKDILGLKEDNGVGHGSKKKTLQRLETTSLVDETTVCGRDDDKKVIIDFLHSEDHDESSRNNLTVVSIVGMGGMGKTTIAQLVYNDRSMDDEFQLKAWVYVSEDFDIAMVTRTILEALNLPTSGREDLNLNMLQVKLKEKLKGKKFLLVLDDVWEEKNKKWEALQAPLLYGARGSKILITTRSKKVALAMRCAHIHELKQLSEDQSWLLFSKHALCHANSTFDFKEMGRMIVKKCNGLPLALKAIGSLLHTKSSYEEWNRILASEIWDISDDGCEISIPALRLSYQFLPSSLKRCFAYCSLIPKDYQFDKDWLVDLWMAENILQSKGMKALGDKFFNDLLLRSFFQRSSSEPDLFVMHDLVNDLPTYVSREFCFRLEEEKEAKNVSKLTRHISYLGNRGKHSEIFKVFHKANKLRTFLHFRDGNMSIEMINDLLCKCKYSRVLSLSFDDQVYVLPDSIGNLKHLRYLELFGSDLEKLPDSICLLYNLQTLKLSGCDSLEELPCDMHILINLHHLDFRGTKVKEMPNGIEKLRKLEALGSFCAGKRCESNINQLGELKLLRGTLWIEELQNVIDPMDALAANLKSKIHLKVLRLKWSTNNDVPEHEKDVLEMLQPPPNLKHLSIIKYGGTRFPDWIGDMSNNIVQLELSDCKYCLSLPPLGMLASLKMLIIEGLEGIKSIGAEFYGNNNSSSSSSAPAPAPFRSLQILRFENMNRWEEWDCEYASSSSSGTTEGGAGAAFPCLQELIINDCPRLRNKLPQRLPSVLKLVIKHCKQLVCSLECASAIREIDLYHCGKLKLEFPFSNNTCYLQTIRVFWSPNVEFEIRHPFNALQRLNLRDSYYSLKALPLDLFPKLQELDLEGCRNLERLDVGSGSGGVTSLTQFSIFGCPKLASFPEGLRTLFPSLTGLWLYDCPEVQCKEEDGGGFPTSLKILEIANCPKLLASRIKWDLHTCTSLTFLIIQDEDGNYADYQGLLPPNLKSLNDRKVGPSSS